MGLKREDLEKWGAIEPGQPVYYSLDAPPEPPPDAVDDRPILEDDTPRPKGQRIVVDGQEYYLTIEQLMGKALIPREILFRPYQEIGPDGTLITGPGSKRWFLTALANMAQNNPSMFYEQLGNPTNKKEIDKIREIFFKFAHDNYIDADQMIAMDDLMQERTDDLFGDPIYGEDGTLKPYGYTGSYSGVGHELYNPDTRLWEFHPAARKGGSFKPPGHSYYKDRDAIQSDLAKFGPIHPEEDQDKSKEELGQYLVDQMGDLPEQLDTMYDVAPVQPEPNPIPQQSLQTQDMGIQSPPPGMVTGQLQQPQQEEDLRIPQGQAPRPFPTELLRSEPQQPNPPQFNPTDVIYGNDGEPAPERPRKETEWGYYYE